MDFIRTVLEKLGYVVLVGVDGRDGLEVFQSRREEIALVVLNPIMARLSSQEILAKLRAIDPSVKVIFSSEDDDHTVAQVGAEVGDYPSMDGRPLLDLVRRTLAG